MGCNKRCIHLGRGGRRVTRDRSIGAIPEAARKLPVLHGSSAPTRALVWLAFSNGAAGSGLGPTAMFTQGTVLFLNDCTLLRLNYEEEPHEGLHNASTPPRPCLESF